MGILVGGEDEMRKLRTQLSEVKKELAAVGADRDEAIAAINRHVNSLTEKNEEIGTLEKKNNILQSEKVRLVQDATSLVEKLKIAESNAEYFKEQCKNCSEGR